MKRLVAVLLLSVASVAAMAAPASATTGPTVTIGGNGPKVAFSMTTLTGAPQSTDCTNNFVAAFILVNTTKQPVVVTEDGAALPALQPNIQDGFCFQGFPSGTQFVFGLMNRQGTKTLASTFTVTVA